MKEEEINITPTSNLESNGPVIVDTNAGAKDGQTKCPACGATDIATNIHTGKLRCNFCRLEFEPQTVEGIVKDVKSLQGQVIASGATDIAADTKDVLTFKCSSCGAEVVVDTKEALQARCHWCRNTLSVQEQIPNGAVPDVVLPFRVPKEEARAEIEKFVGKRKFFANPKFRAEFTTENIIGVYFPYMLVDINGHSTLIGEGEHQTRRYTVGSGDNQETYYDADLYHVEREFDITINGLSVESSLDRLDTSNKSKTNNIINSIMPFDVENCVKYDANYLRGYNSERRDTNIEDLRPIVYAQSKDVARFAANETLEFYDRGVAWSTDNLYVHGQQWQAAYLPVWLYSYQEVKGDKKLLHYVAVNARTKETMGSVPIHMPKLVLASCIVEVVAFFLMIWADSDESWIFLLAGIVYFLIMYARYRNQNARHTYETETKKEVANMRKADTFIRTKKRMRNATMDGANNRAVRGSTVANANLLKNFKLGSKTVSQAQLVNDNTVANTIKQKIAERDNQNK